ncbi:hypothetical protein N7535_006722 [Penicillium sp. DV-2018c]|nr:hypothetical protein N7535_006722 [Penicillium sp. DV-2018c]
MGKPRPQKKKSSKPREKSVLGPGGSISKGKMAQDPSVLLDQATILLQTGRADEALVIAQQALELTAENTTAQLPALNLLGEINVELGDIDTARNCFLQAVQLDQDGSIPEEQGGGAEKFLWLAQLSEQGGKDSVLWFEMGVTSLRKSIADLEGKASPSPEDIADITQKKTKMSNALCAVAETYMTDLSWEEDAEARCEALVTEALLVTPEAPEVLQTLASVRISQLRTEDARAALTRSMTFWKDLAPEDPKVPDFALRISLARLLMEVTMEFEALEVLERLILEDDQSVEAWYLGGWCLFLLAEKQVAPKDVTAAEPTESPRQASLEASREWLKQSLKLYDALEYEDERLRDHALELVQEMNKELGEYESEAEEEGEAEDEEDVEIEADSDDEMADYFQALFLPEQISSATERVVSVAGILKSCKMDLVPAPKGEDSLKTSVFEVEPVDSEEEYSRLEEPAAFPEIDPITSDIESGSDDADGWDDLSDCDEEIQFLRDDEIRDGLVPGACTLEEAAAYRRRLHEIGKAAFVEETIIRETVTAKKLCTAFGIAPPAFLEGAPDEAYHSLLAIALSREFSRRPKLPQYNTVDDAVRLLHESKNIIVLTGAGISTSLGIPDFRSKDTGLYAKLAHLGLSDPQEVFDIHVFREDPGIFFSIAKDILPTEKKWSPTHGFIRLLQDKGKLLTNYTQNIDNIEANAGVSPEKIVQCHGSFATATCVKCRFKVPGKAIFDEVREGNIPYCTACKERIAAEELKSQGLKRKRSSNGQQKDRKISDSSDEDDYEIPTPGVMKPDITFFGEDLPDEFGQRLLHQDRELADLVIVIGTSLKVAPVAEVPGIIPRNVPQIYISRTPVTHTEFDIDLLGDCDVVVSELSRRAGWNLQHHMIADDEEVDITPVEGYESRHVFKVVGA